MICEHGHADVDRNLDRTRPRHVRSSQLPCSIPQSGMQCDARKGRAVILGVGPGPRTFARGFSRVKKVWRFVEQAFPYQPLFQMSLIKSQSFSKKSLDNHPIPIALYATTLESIRLSAVMQNRNQSTSRARVDIVLIPKYLVCSCWCLETPRLSLSSCLLIYKANNYTIN